jgi:hypothetical protein
MRAREYKWIRRWAKHLGHADEVIASRQRDAVRSQAPADALYRHPITGEWVLLSELTANPLTQEWARQFERTAS